MGLEVAAIVMAVAEVGKAGFEIKAASEQEKALDQQGKELQLQTQQKTLANYDTMEKVLDAQAAHMTTTGLAFSSPSYNAIQRATVNIGSKEIKNTEIEGNLEQENIDIEKSNVKSSLFAQLFGDTATGALGAADIISKMPTLAAGS